MQTKGSHSNLDKHSHWHSHWPLIDPATDLPHEFHEAFTAACDEEDDARARALILDTHPADFADLLHHLPPRYRRQAIALACEGDPEWLASVPDAFRKEALENFSSAHLAQIINEFDSDDAVAFLDALDEERRHETIRLLNPVTRAAVLEGLSFPEETAGRLMQKQVVAALRFWTVGKTIDYLRAAGPDDLPQQFSDLFVVDPMHRVDGVVPLSQLLRNNRATRLEDIMDTDVDRIPVHMPSEDVALLFRRHDLLSAPVVDDLGRLLGVITIDDIVDVIDDEAEHDLYALSGVNQAESVSTGVLDAVRVRWVWLGVNLLTAILASVVIAQFETTISHIVALAVLMPIITSMGGNGGTQTLTIAVRAIAMRELSVANAWRILVKETLSGAANGLIFALFSGALVMLWYQNIELSLLFGASMIITLAVAGFAGAFIPILLERFGVDPAIASSVLLTTITDVVGFLSFLGFASWLLL